MLETYSFRLTQLRYVKAAMDEIAAFRPDGKQPADIQAEIDAAVAVMAAFQGARAARNLAHGEFHEAWAKAHDTCIQVYAIMKSRYRKDPGSLESINKLPIDDKTPTNTRVRMSGMSELWQRLPNPPGSSEPFEAWDGMGRTEFDAELTDFAAKQDALAGVDQDYEVAEAKLHETEDAMADSVTAALVQGRAQFPEGTSQRELIDNIPTEPAAQEPGQAVISVATSPGAGQVHLEYDAPHATSWDVLHQGQGETDFSVVASEAIVKVYDATGLAPGDHQYKVIGHNSRGDGPESLIATVTLA